MTRQEKILTLIVKRLREAETILIVTHARPDGDALGCASALAQAARTAGKAAHVLLPGADSSVPQRYEFLFPGDRPAAAERFGELAASADAVVVLDTCAFGQLDGLEQALGQCREKIVVMDHHATRDDVGAVQWIDRSAAATGVMVAELLEALGWAMDAEVAEALATAVTSDTGWFRFANTDARCLGVFAGLLAAGVRADKLYARLFQTDRPQRLRLMTRMLESLELHCADRLAVMTIRKGDFQAAGANSSETENLVNEALRIGSVESVALLVEDGDVVRVSLRSRDAIDVAELAARFGGGGHARAAGFRLPEDIDSLKPRIVAEFEKEFVKTRD